MFIEGYSLSAWMKLRFQFVHDETPMRNYTVWDIIRFFDEGQINDDTVIAICSPAVDAGYDKPKRFADT